MCGGIKSTSCVVDGISNDAHFWGFNVPTCFLDHCGHREIRRIPQLIRLRVLRIYVSRHLYRELPIVSVSIFLAITRGIPGSRRSMASPLCLILFIAFFLIPCEPFIVVATQFGIFCPVCLKSASSFRFIASLTLCRLTTFAGLCPSGIGFPMRPYSSSMSVRFRFRSRPRSSANRISCD
jgi:hypothetical protein